jgi:nucleosome binding factor SPN SPT16 subunit
VRHAASIAQEIKTLHKTVKLRESERTERASLVRQESLVLSKGRVFRLPDLFVKPPLMSGAKGTKMTGTLEAHVNGFRYQVGGGTLFAPMATPCSVRAVVYGQ